MKDKQSPIMLNPLQFNTVKEMDIYVREHFLEFQQEVLKNYFRFIFVKDDYMNDHCYTFSLAHLRAVPVMKSH